MSGVWGDKIKLSIFGESHGRAIGVTIDGLKPGIELDLEFIKREMKRRAPGNNEYSTTRKEADEFEILSGVFNGKTTGTPLCAIIYNNNPASRDYEKMKSIMRPSHGDYTGYIKYNGFNDYRGGGHFSGRITAPLVFAGAVCKKILQEKGILIGSHIRSIGKIEGKSLMPDEMNRDVLLKLLDKDFPVVDENLEETMKNAILTAKAEGDSLGGIVECIAINIPAGIGEPFFDSVESTIAHLLFSIPAIKGLEFGAGFEISKLRGTEAKDEFYMEKDEVRTRTNNNGGILGGITNGMPIVFRVALKPTPSIGKVQNTIDIEKKENTILEVQGRHDPCIVQRALPVIEGVCAIALLNLI